MKVPAISNDHQPPRAVCPYICTLDVYNIYKHLNILDNLWYGEALPPRAFVFMHWATKTNFQIFGQNWVVAAHSKF